MADTMGEGLDLDVIVDQEEGDVSLYGCSPLMDSGWVRWIADTAKRRRISVVAVFADGSGGWIPDDAGALVLRAEADGGTCWIGQRPGCRGPFTSLWVGSNEAIVGALVCVNDLGGPESPSWRTILLEALVLADLA